MNIVHGIIFKGRTPADDVSKPSSHLLRHLVTRWSGSRGCRHFLSCVFGVDTCFVFDFIVFYLWVNSDITCWQNRQMLGSKFHIWDRVLRRLTGKYHQSSSRSIRVRNEFGFKLIVFFFRKSMWILFTNGVLPTIRHMDKILGKVSPSPNSPKITVAYGELRVYFALHWLDLNGWDDTEFASRSSVEWRGIHQWGITCLIDVVILRTVTQQCG